MTQFVEQSQSVRLQKGARIYFIGIGGISMSGLAEIAQAAGFIVGGSDRHLSPRTEYLASRGILVHAGHQAGPRGAANAAGIGLGEFHARGSQQFHIGSPVKIIEGSPFRVKGHGSILPSHVVDQKKEDIGPGKGFGLPCPAASRCGQSGCQKPRSE